MESHTPTSANLSHIRYPRTNSGLPSCNHARGYSLVLSSRTTAIRSTMHAVGMRMFLWLTASDKQAWQGRYTCVHAYCYECVPCCTILYICTVWLENHKRYQYSQADQRIIPTSDMFPFQNSWTKKKMCLSCSMLSRCFTRRWKHVHCSIAGKHASISRE